MPYYDDVYVTVIKLFVLAVGSVYDIDALKVDKAPLEAIFKGVSKTFNVTVGGILAPDNISVTALLSGIDKDIVTYISKVVLLLHI
jgi:hypothetical protein